MCVSEDNFVGVVLATVPQIQVVKLWSNALPIPLSHLSSPGCFVWDRSHVAQAGLKHCAEDDLEPPPYLFVLNSWRKGLWGGAVRKHTNAIDTQGKGKTSAKQRGTLLGFKAFEEFSSPNLGLVNLKKAWMVGWPRTVVWFVLSSSIRRGLLVGDQGLQSLCFTLLGFCLKYRGWRGSWPS